MKNDKANVSESVWNMKEVLARADNDQELLLDLLSIFKEDFPRNLKSLEEAVAAGDLRNATSVSHTLKGMLSNLGGSRAAAAAAKLEQLAASGQKASLGDALQAFEQEAAILVPELEAYIAEVQG
jgi:HPt (histidine-containing phosphotransfer) domain-containing protein